MVELSSGQRASADRFLLCARVPAPVSADERFGGGSPLRSSLAPGQWIAGAAPRGEAAEQESGEGVGRGLIWVNADWGGLNKNLLIV